MPESGGTVHHVEGYVKTIVFVYLPIKRAIRTRIVYYSGVVNAEMFAFLVLNVMTDDFSSGCFCKWNDLPSKSII